MFGIANTLALSVFERTREIGLLRAVGMSRKQVRQTVRWESVLIALLGTRGPVPRRGFFDPDNFTFGDALERSRLEAVIQSVPGVRAVEAMRIRRRGFFDWRPFAELFYAVAPDEVIRLQNDAEHPERGTLRLFPKGGA